jgi:hypothetical protein
MFDDQFLPTFPYLQLPLYNHLQKMGTEVIYVLQEGDIRLTDRKLVKVFGRLNIRTVKKLKQIKSCFSRGDLLVMRFAYKLAAGKVANIIRAARYNILMLDPAGIDIRVRESPAQYLTAKSESLKRAALKKFRKHYRNIFVTGTIHNDAVAITEVDREKFMKSYGMNPEKKFVILTPANPGELGHQKGINSEYSKIIRIVQKQCPDYEIAVKAHPLDYTASMKAQPGIIHKNEHYNGKHSWEQFAPGVRVIKADEGYRAIKACDAVLNVRSSIAMETALFRKPLININRSKYTTNWPFDPSTMIDVKIGELATTLNTFDYAVDEQACLAYVKRETFSDDGKAYIRTADAAIKILEGRV